MVRFESTQEAGGGNVILELSNLQVGSQSAALFEIPAGYTKFAMPTMPGMTGMPRGGGRGGDRPSPEEMKRMMKEMQERLQQ